MAIARYTVEISHDINRTPQESMLSNNKLHFQQELTV